MKSRISKLLSIILAFTMLITVCFVSTVSAAGEHNYYVMAGGKGDGSSPASPVATVADAVAKIKEAGLKAGDTANVYIMQSSGWNAIPEGQIGGSTKLTQPHNMTAWSADGKMTAHTAKIVIKSMPERIMVIPPTTVMFILQIHLTSVQMQV